MDKEKQEIPWGKLDPDPDAPPIEPVTFEPVAPIQMAPPDDHAGEKYVVLYGYGRINPVITHYVDELTFKGGVCKDVSYKRAQQLRYAKEVGNVLVMPEKSTERDWISATGLDPSALVPKQWGGTQSEFKELVETYGLDGVRQMAHDLASEVYSRDTQQQRQPTTLLPPGARDGK